MSSTTPTTRGGGGSDFFPTDPRITADFLRRAGHRLPPGLWWEPACGNGAIVRAVEAWRPGQQRWGLCDIRDVREEMAAAGPLEVSIADTVVVQGDFLKRTAGADLRGADCALPRVQMSNPPFSLAEEFARQCLYYAGDTGVVVLLLRINFLGSVGRLGFWKEHPNADVYPIVPRPSFSPDGKTDSCEYGWFLWSHDSTGQIHHPTEPWR